MQSNVPDGVEYVFDHSTSDDDIRNMREANMHELADKCETLLDEPPAYNGFSQTMQQCGFSCYGQVAQG